MEIFDAAFIISVLQSVIVIGCAYISSKILGYLLIRPIEKKVRRKGMLSQLRRSISAIVYLIAFVLILSIFNIDVTAAIAGFGIGALVIGFGLKDILSNWVSGVIIMGERIYQIGDVIKVDSTTGVVTDISLRSTRLKTYDKNEVIIPNSKIIEGKVMNLTSGKNETISSINFLIDYTCDTKKAKETIKSVISKDEAVIFDEKKKREIRFLIKTKEWAIEIETLFWINDPPREEFIKSRITEAVKSSFDNAGITPPLPGFMRKNHLKPQ